ncbi:hypothetical protein ACFW90_17555, partial [Streptomyces amritsarensis]
GARAPPVRLLPPPLVCRAAARPQPRVVATAVPAGAIAAGVVGAVVAVPLVSVVWSVHSALREARRTAGG